MVTLAGLFVYPVKSCRGVALDSARLAAAGLENDREWLVVTPGGRFLTQREAPRLACVDIALDGQALRMSSSGAGAVVVPHDVPGERVEVKIWDDCCAAFDQGDEVAAWLAALLGREVRLVRFDPAHRRPSDRAWTGEVDALNRFTDGFPLLAIGRASLDDLNVRLPAPLPMDRFRPNLVFEGLEPYGEDDVFEFVTDGVRLRTAKPCTRCVITTTDQQTGRVTGEEPLRTLKTYRWDRALHGVAFGQNVVVAEGAGEVLRRGQSFSVRRK
jgi:hypothetical protein